jgi:hypothetical protein
VISRHFRAASGHQQDLARARSEHASLTEFAQRTVHQIINRQRGTARFDVLEYAEQIRATLYLGEATSSEVHVDAALATTSDDEGFPRPDVGPDRT